MYFMSKLLIIESPNKIDTIAKYLNDKEFKIVATVGHIRDLSKKNMGFDEKTLEPHWIIPSKKKNEQQSKEEIIQHIKALAKDAEQIYLATDPDREGEAISWHVYSVLNQSDQKKCQRITFNEITKDAIVEALNHPRQIDELWVNSQFARRLLDRLVGYKVSKIVHSKVHGKSAGRVQSVALKMIYDREREIEKFKVENWWTVDPIYKDKFPLILREINPKIPGLNYKKVNDEDATGIDFKDEASAQLVKDSLKDEYKLYAIDEPRAFTVKPKEPYKTSTLQQEAITRLGWSISRVTSVAQNLYEGVKLDNVSTALISYPRTDSVRISQTFKNKLKKFIINQYGEKYYHEYEYVNKKNATNVQDAHEAIRVIDPYLTPTSLKKKLTHEQYALYNLIWSRTVASFMAPAIYENTIVRFINNNNKFYTYSRTIKYDGFKKVYNEEDASTKLRRLNISGTSIGDVFKIDEIRITKHQSDPPARFNQASLVKELDEAGVGRPSTYRSMADMALKRGYARLENRAYVMLELGNNVVKFLSKYFNFIVDVGFTSQVEQGLDDIADGKKDWKELIRDFQPILEKDIVEAKKDKEFNNDKVGRKCPLCGGELIYRYSHKTGVQFIGCSNFPKCKYVENSDKENPQSLNQVELDLKCPNCGHNLVIRTGKKRHNKFIGCSNFPKCKYIQNTTKEELQKIMDEHILKPSLQSNIQQKERQ